MGTAKEPFSPMGTAKEPLLELCFLSVHTAALQDQGWRQPQKSPD
jgi:hypothetical protein